MKNEVRDMNASIKARLKNIAKEYKKTFNLILRVIIGGNHDHLFSFPPGNL